MRTFLIRLVISLICPAAMWATSPGTHFQQDLSWTEVRAKAEAEKKYIFIDCYATWCGPCKQMDEKVYPDPEVGEFMNAHFVSIKVQMDVTKRIPPKYRNGPRMPVR